MKVLAILRVSTADQSLDAQKLQIQGWAARENLVVDYREEPLGTSGAAEERPVLDQAVSELVSGDVLVTVALDRLGRSTLRVVRLLDDLHARGVRVVSLREALDMGTPFGKFAAVILAAVAELERGMIVSRTKRGMAAAKAKGSPVGHLPDAWPERSDAALLCRTAAGESVESFARELVVFPRIAIDDRGEDVSKSKRKGVGTRDGIRRAPSANAARRRLKWLRASKEASSPDPACGACPAGGAPASSQP